MRNNRTTVSQKSRSFATDIGTSVLYARGPHAFSQVFLLLASDSRQSHGHRAGIRHGIMLKARKGGPHFDQDFPHRSGSRLLVSLSL